MTGLRLDRYRKGMGRLVNAQFKDSSEWRTVSLRCMLKPCAVVDQYVGGGPHADLKPFPVFCADHVCPKSTADNRQKWGNYEAFSLEDKSNQLFFGI